MLFLFAIISNNFLFAQQNNFEIRGTGADVYLVHTVAPKEGLYSIGRMYNVNPKELAAFNHVPLETGLKIGQALRIPLNRINFTQTGMKAKTEANIPVYHTVESGETLYRLGVNFNKVPIASIKKWNHLQSDEVTAGMPLIIGFLKVDKANSFLAKHHSIPSAPVAQTPKNEVTPEEKKPEQSVTTEPEIKKQEPEVTERKPAPTNENIVAATPVNNSSVNNISGGYFKNLYSRQNENKSPVKKNGEAGVFKSTSGWQDSKFYCFNNDVSAGTILRITNNATGKSVYAKVLDAIPDIKQNDGLSVVISNAAANELGAGDNKFDCVISFGK